MSADRSARGTAAKWRKLEQALARLTKGNTTRDRIYVRLMQLRPLMRWCVANGIWPSETTDDHLRQYVAQKRRRRVSNAPTSKRRLTQDLRKAWNFAAAAVPGWPAITFALAPPLFGKGQPVMRGDRVICYAEAQFQPSLLDEIARYTANGGFLERATDDRASGVSHVERMRSRLGRAGPPLSAEKILAYPARRLRRLAVLTLIKHRSVILQAATALHQAGEVELGDLKRIADVATPRAAAIMADSLAARRQPGARPSVYPAQCVFMIGVIARRCGVSFSVLELAAMRELTQDLLVDVEVTTDLSERNLKRLAQFDDPRVFAMLVALPAVVMKQLERRRAMGTLTRIDARKAEAAVAIEILNMIPLRRGSLINLDVARNFVPPWRQRGNGKLTVYGDQEKSEQRLEAPLSVRSWRLITLYCKHYRPMLPGAQQSTFLFPAETATRHQWPQVLSDRIKRFVKAQLRVDVHVHLWRHIMGSKLDERSNLPDGAARLLGHILGSVNTKRYVRVRSNDAAWRLRKITDAVRGHGARQLGYRKHRVRRRKLVAGAVAPLGDGWFPQLQVAPAHDALIDGRPKAPTGV